MPYATQDDLISRFGEVEIEQLTDRTGAAGAIDAAVVAAKLADADGEIDGYLQGRYTLPLAVVPISLKRIACDIARYHLYDDRATDQVTKRYTDAIKFLTLVGKGELQLGLSPDQTSAASSGGPEFIAPGRVFSTDTLRDFTDQ